MKRNKQKKLSITPEQVQKAILEGWAERVRKDIAAPIISQRDDGVIFDTRWQDDIADAPREKPAD